MEPKLLEDWNKILELHSSKINDFLSNKGVSTYCREYEKSRKEIIDPGFNVFLLASDLYYRENFHSEIIKSFLDPRANHGENNLFLNQFIKMLGLDELDYVNSSVECEKHKIDILISNEQTKKAIIIENKMNNAGDMSRQIPRYFDIMKNEGFDVEAIVYLPLIDNKTPDTSTWSDEEIKSININTILKIIPAYSIHEPINLVDKWITPLIVQSSNLDNVSILRQYACLIKSLSTSVLDTIALEKFYTDIQDDKIFDTAKLIRDMLDYLPIYMATRVENKFKNQCSPFEKIWRCQNIAVVFEKCMLEDNYFKMEIVCSDNGYEVDIYTFEKEDLDIKEYLSSIDILKDFTFKNNSKCFITTHFNMNEEDKLFDFISNIKIEFANFIKKCQLELQDIQKMSHEM